MTDEYLSYIVLLEKTLVSFYEETKRKMEYEKIKTVLEFMETHSAAHAETVAELKEKMPRPDFDKDFMFTFQNNLNDEVLKDLKDSRDLVSILQTLADAEESIGHLYKNIADHLRLLATHYTNIAKVVDQLALEEYEHRDILLKDKENLSKK